ncbi:MAG: T9SS type A sorting domain-containing protein [Saprospiraceae bacterium]|nr:T9SS type A sorting domain-containing protein [Saprospiraceae bacterium]
MRNIFFSLLLLFVGSNLMAQRCGVTPEDNMKITIDLLKNKADVAKGIIYERGTAYVPIKFHLVANDDGTTKVAESKIFDLLCGLNANYSNVGLQFYISDGFNYINDTRINTTPKDGFSALFIKAKKVSNAINVFIVTDIDEASGQNGEILGFADYDGDYLVVLKKECKKEASTISHELGHYFSLLHTHNGWDGHPYDVAVDGMKVGLYSPVQGVKKGYYPGQQPTTSLKNECQSGFECDIRGDYICDTPPDYAMGEAWWNNNCSKWTPIVISPCGDTVHPQEINYMGYFSNCTSYKFTPMQITQLVASYNSTRRNYIRTNIAPVTTNGNVTDLATDFSPAANTTTPFSNKVDLDWSDVPNATHYYLEIALIDFLGDYERKVLTKSDFTFTTYLGNPIVANKSYVWRVKAFNNLYTCANISSKIKFTTGISNANLDLPENVSDWSVYPNPSKFGNTTQLQIDATKNLEPVVEIYDALGRKLLTKNVQVQIGPNNINLETENFKSGLYFVTIKLDNKIYSKKLYFVD